MAFSPFDLILQGTKALIQEQEQSAGMSMQEQRDLDLAVYMAEQETPMIPVDSTAIESFSYDALANALGVVWVDSRGGPGHEYVYYNVDPIIAQGLDEAPSKGTYMNDIIKQGFFPFTRLS